MQLRTAPQHPGQCNLRLWQTIANRIYACYPALKRGSKVVTEFDLYDLLLKGDKSKDVLLLPEDVIYFAPVGPEVAIGGQVNVPAIYQL